MLSTTFTTINLSQFVPQTAVLIDVNIRMKTLTDGWIDIGLNSNNVNTVCELSDADTIYQHLTVPIDIFQSFVVRLSNSFCTAYITVQGYYCQ